MNLVLGQGKGVPVDGQPDSAGLKGVLRQDNGNGIRPHLQQGFKNRLC